VVLAALSPAPVLAEDGDVSARANDTARLEVSAGPALKVDGSFATAKWGLELSVGKPLLYAPYGPLRLVIDGRVSSTFAPGSGDALVAAGVVADFELRFSQHVGLDFGMGLGLGAALGNQSELGGNSVVEIGVFVEPFEDPRRRLEFQLRDITAVLPGPPGPLQTPIVLSLAMGFETGF
jgi:hypothetical protein